MAAVQLPFDLGIPTRHIFMYSGGAGGWSGARRVVETHSADHLTLLFTDTLMEATDLYRFLVESACQLIGTAPPADWLADVRLVPEWHEDRFGRRIALDDLRDRAAVFAPHLVWIADGRDPWEVFFDERMLGNSRIDPCSKILKRQMADKWLSANCHPDNTVVYLGIDWSESHRFDDGEGHGAFHRYARAGWVAEAPLCDAPFVSLDKIARIRAGGMEPSSSYLDGASHDNCSKFCIKAGQGQYGNMLADDPVRYDAHETLEQEFIAFIGRDVSILTDTRGGEKKTLTLKRLRERTQGGAPVDKFDIGGCGCFVTEDEEAA